MSHGIAEKTIFIRKNLHESQQEKRKHKSSDSYLSIYLGEKYPDHDTHLAMLLLLLSAFTRLTWEQTASQNLKGLFDHLVGWVYMAAAYMYYLRKQASNSLETQN